MEQALRTKGKIGKYQLVKSLGEVSTYLAINTETKAHVIIKEIDSVPEVSLLYEKLVKKSPSKYFLCPLEVMEDVFNIYVVYEHCQAGTLANYINVQKENLSEEFLRQIMDQVIVCCHELQTSEIPIRSFRPQDIFIAYEDEKAKDKPTIKVKALNSLSSYILKINWKTCLKYIEDVLSYLMSKVKEVSEECKDLAQKCKELSYEQLKAHPFFAKAQNSSALNEVSKAILHGKLIKGNREQHVDWHYICTCGTERGVLLECRHTLCTGCVAKLRLAHDLSEEIKGFPETRIQCPACCLPAAIRTQHVTLVSVKLCCGCALSRTPVLDAWMIENKVIPGDCREVRVTFRSAQGFVQSAQETG